MWQKIDNSLYQKFEFNDFDEAFSFVEKVAQVARELNHHPVITNSYNVVELSLMSHDAGDTVTKKDTEFASRIDEILAKKASKMPAGKAAKLAAAHSDGLQLSEAKLFTDGGSRGNPGPSATGYVILDMDDNVVKKEGVYLGIATNNQAEYKALQAGLEAALAIGVTKVHVYMDSMLVVSQVNGAWKVKHQEMVPLHQAVRALVDRFEKVTVEYVPRAMNHIADAMVNECLDAQ